MELRLVVLLMTFVHFSLQSAPPNIVWICIEDASPHIGCYGEKAIQTPHIDQLAADGVRFDNAFVTSPVCSASRSAMVTGMHQVTSGFHLHRSQRFKGKGSGNKAFYESYKVPSAILTVPELFKQAGYYTSNKKKTDYNFERKGLYDSQVDWAKRKPGQPFFAQFQLNGGKNRRSIAGVDLTKMSLPPYYADTPIMRQDWARYLGSWVIVDAEVKAIMARLKAENLLENTYVFLWTDHGVSHIRGKQFLYEEGIKIPLIIRGPKKKLNSSERDDLVSHIDIPVTSLAVAGIEVPVYMQGKNILADNYLPQQKIFSARDRCDETVDIIRSIRDMRYKYIRNFLPDSSHMQRSQYKESKKIVAHSIELFHAGKLSPFQARPFLPSRAVEELYDLKNDAHEEHNLALSPEHGALLANYRVSLKRSMLANDDLGLIPEPILEEMGQKYGSKYDVLQHADNKALVLTILEIIEAGEAEDYSALIDGLNSSQAAVRYWAVKALGNQHASEYKKAVLKCLEDKNGAVRVAAAEALGQLGSVDLAAKQLVKEVGHQNLLVGLYALRSLEALGQQAKSVAGPVIKEALRGKYEFSVRVAKRLVKEWQLN